MELLSLSARPALSGASLSFALAVALVLSAPLARAQDDPVVARVNGTDEQYVNPLAQKDGASESASRNASNAGLNEFFPTRW